MINDKLNNLIDKIINEPEYSEYIVAFQEYEGLDPIRFNVSQIQRPNGILDEDIIKDYILDNYGKKHYEIISINMIEKITL